MLNIKNLKEVQNRLEELAKREYYEKLQSEVIDFVKSETFKQFFLDHKMKRELEQSSRVLNNWQKEGLIDRKEEDEGKWRKFNRIESIWLTIISTLREFGLPYHKIKEVKRRLFTTHIKTFKPLEYAIMYSVIQEPIILVVFMNGRASLLPKSLYAKIVGETPCPPHLHFDLLLVSQGEFPNNNFDTIGKNEKKLTDKELQLLYFIRTGDFSTIKVRMKEGEVYLLEAERKIANNMKVVDVIRKAAYQSIEIKTQDGKIINFSSVEKIKL